jgi:predicted anti-sigma-YlaC factor YlaD
VKPLPTPFARRRLAIRWGTALLLPLFLGGCSLQRVAIRAAGGALAAGGATWGSDDDPELVREALPFALKTIEGLLAADPADRRLLLAAASGFTQYAQGFLVPEADYLEESDFARARAERERAGRLLARATGYGLRGLDTLRPGFAAALRDPGRRDTALAGLGPEAVPLLYWTGAAWGARAALALDDPELATDLPLVERLMRRARELAPGFEDGVIHDFYVVWEGARAGTAAGAADRAREALAAARRYAGGRRAAPLVAFAESVAVAEQDRATFTRLLGEALALDAAASGPHRVANLLAQQRARWLLARADDLFLE